MTLIERLCGLFAPRVTITQTSTKMTPEQRKAFYAAFRKMDEAWAEMDKVLRK
jgi:hypothetical protein